MIQFPSYVEYFGRRRSLKAHRVDLTVFYSSNITDKSFSCTSIRQTIFSPQIPALSTPSSHELVGGCSEPPAKLVIVRLAKVTIVSFNAFRVLGSSPQLDQGRSTAPVVEGVVVLHSLPVTGVGLVANALTRPQNFLWQPDSDPDDGVKWYRLAKTCGMGFLSPLPALGAQCTFVVCLGTYVNIDVYVNYEKFPSFFVAIRVGMKNQKKVGGSSRSKR